MGDTYRGLGKLFALKQWVELGEAASCLSTLIGEPIGRDDILRLGLDGHLTLSVRLVTGAYAQCGRTIPLADAKRHTVPCLEGDGFFTFIDGTVIPGERVIVFDDEIRRLAEVWDLPMLGGERLRAEEIYERSHFRSAPEMIDLEGTFVSSPDGLYCKLVEPYGGKTKDPRKPYDPSNYHPTAGLPEDAVLVVRTKALREFAVQFSESENAEAKPLERRERSTLLTIIAALSALAKVDLSKPSSAAVAIESETARMGARVAARTIEGHLGRIPEALEAKQS